MRTQESLLTRRAQIKSDLEDPSLPSELHARLEAQVDILNWIIEGDTLPDEYLIEGQLKHSNEFFERVIIAGVDADGSVYPASSCTQSGEYVLARRPSPQEFEESKES